MPKEPLFELLVEIVNNFQSESRSIKDKNTSLKSHSKNLDFQIIAEALKITKFEI